MAICEVNQTVDPRLVELMDKYGQAAGALRYLREKTDPTPTNYADIKSDVTGQDYKVIIDYSESGANFTYDLYKEAFGEKYVIFGTGIDLKKNRYWKVFIKNPELDTNSEDALIGDTTANDTLSIEELVEEGAFDRLSKFLKAQKRNKFNRLSKITSKLAEAKRKGNTDEISHFETLKKRLENDIATLEAEIADYNNEKSIENMLGLANLHIDWAISTLKNPEISSSEINEVNFVIDLWSNIREYIYGSTEEIPESMLEAFSEIQTKILSEDVFGSYWRTVSEFLARQAKYKSSTALLNEMYNIEDTNIGWSFGLGLSDTGIKLISETEKLLRNSLNRADFELKEWATKIQTKFKGLKDKGKLEKFLKLIYQVDANGKPTGDMTNRYSKAYYRARSSARRIKNAGLASAKGDTKKIARALRIYNKWVKENEIFIDMRYFISDEFKSQKDIYINKLVKEFGKERVDEMISQATEQYDKYIKDLKDFKNIQEDKLASGLINAEGYNEAINGWKDLNDPLIWLYQQDPISDGEIRYYKQNKDNPYIIRKPRKIDSNGKSTGWYDANYEIIEQDADIKDAYDFVRDFMGEMMSYIPGYLKKDNDINAAFLPRVRKALLDSLSLKDVSGIAAVLKEDWINSITSEEGLDNRFLEIDPLTEQPYKNIPVNFLGATPIEDRSMELDKVLAVFAKMAIEYKWKSRVEDNMILVNKFLENVGKSKDRKSLTSNELQNLRNMYQYTMDALVYNQAKLDEGKLKQKIFSGDTFNILNEDKAGIIRKRYSELKSDLQDENKILKLLKSEFKEDIEIISKRKRNEQLKELRDTIEEQLYNKEITEEEYSRLMKPLEEEANSLGRNLVMSKMMDKALRYTQDLALGFNPFSGVNNLIFGVTSNMMWSAGNTDFTPKQMMQAMGLMWKSSLTLNNKKLDKVANLIMKYDILQDSLEFKGLTENEKLEKIRNFPYLFLKAGDFMIKGQTFIATMLNEKITDLNGNERSLYDAYDNEGNWIESEFGKDVDWIGSITNESELTKFLAFKNKTTALIKKLHGNFDKLSPAQYKKYIIGRMLGQFRFSWMVEGFAQRWKDRTFDPYLERDIEGRYVTYGKLGFVKSLQVLTKLMFMQTNAFKGVKAQDRAIVEENMRKNLAEIYIYASMFLIYMLLKAGLDDDDEDNEATYSAMNMLNRVMADTTFYFSPNTIVSIWQDPFPVMKLPIKAKKAFSSSWQLIIDEDLTDHQKEQKWANITNMFPYINQYNRFKYLSNKELPY